MCAAENEKKKYRVNLPQTRFPMKASLVTREPERLKQWEQVGLDQQILAQAQRRRVRFTLHDGPPYANGKIHIGHALNKTLKDIIVKFRAMQGKGAVYVPGWDCHGLPIEQALLKELDKKKDEVDQLEFRQQARKYAGKYIKIQMEDFRRLGIFGAWDNPYLTMSRSYQASIARAFYELYEQGYVYRGEKPIYWCPECETALAEAELEYQDKTTKAIFVAFPIPQERLPATASVRKALTATDSLALLIWTTTPWTLPANVGAAVHPDLEYGYYRVAEHEVLIFATALAQRLQQQLGFARLDLLHTCSGRHLIHDQQSQVLSYAHPFIERVGRLILADYVTATDGTGIVHIAPGHGEEDYAFGHLQNGLPIVSPVDHQGRFISDFGTLMVKGRNIFDANPVIIEHLRSAGLLKGIEDHQHSYPFCWRSKTPVIVRSTPQWFLKVDHAQLRERLKQVISDPACTQWFPDWGKNRILGMIDVRPDWCLSRQRLWGVPIPMARHRQTGAVYLNKAFKQRVLEVFEAEGADAWFKYPKEHFLGNGPEVRDLELETDILDVWFDSGVSHQAVLNHGHQLGYPADLYLEGSDQHRGWFQTSLITAVALTGQAPFKQVLTHGFVVDGQGRKMSKSLGNVVSPQDVLKHYGADILRLWVSSCDTNTDIRLSDEIIERMAEAYRKIRNTFRYMLGSLADFDVQRDAVAYERMESIDRWVLSRLHQVAGEVVSCYEAYRFHRIYHVVYEFCITELSAFYLDVLKDRLYCDHPNDAKRRSAQSAIFILTKALCQLLAPVLVFTADEVWESFPFGPEKSVHLAVWDASLWAACDEALIKQWEEIRAVRAQVDGTVEALRAQGKLTRNTLLECQVRLRANRQALQRLQTFKEDLQLGLIASDLVLEEGNQAQQGGYCVTITDAPGQKCARCWRYFPEVGTLADPALCTRCFAVEGELEKASP